MDSARSALFIDILQCVVRVPCVSIVVCTSGPASCPRFRFLYISFPASYFPEHEHQFDDTNVCLSVLLKAAAFSKYVAGNGYESPSSFSNYDCCDAPCNQDVHGDARENRHAPTGRADRLFGARLDERLKPSFAEGYRVERVSL